MEKAEHWIMRLGRAYGTEVPEVLQAEDSRLKSLLEDCCRGPYDPSGAGIGLALYLEGRFLPVKKTTVKYDRFSNNFASAGIYLKQSDWDVPLTEYRSRMWGRVKEAIWGCGEILSKNRTDLELARLRKDIEVVEIRFLNNQVLSERLFDIESSGECSSIKEAAEGLEIEEVGVTIQYRVEGHGSGSDHDKRAAVENLLGEFLEETDLGYCDGGDIGSGTMNIFCIVKPNRGVGTKIIEALRRNRMLDGATIAEARADEERVIWPPDFKGEFQLIYSTGSHTE